VGVALGLFGGMLLLGVVLLEVTRTRAIDPDELRSTLADVLADAPAGERSDAIVIERSCDEGDGSPGLYSSATEVWTVPAETQAEALDQIDARSTQLGYDGAGRGAADGALRAYFRSDQPAVIEVRARDTTAGREIIVSVYDTCSP